jgi:hypothetical protein
VHLESGNGPRPETIPEVGQPDGEARPEPNGLEEEGARQRRERPGALTPLWKGRRRSDCRGRAKGPPEAPASSGRVSRRNPER